MSTIAIDTYKTIQKLQEKGFSLEPAEGVVEALTESALVTKTDLSTKHHATWPFAYNPRRADQPPIIIARHMFDVTARFVVGENPLITVVVRVKDRLWDRRVTRVARRPSQRMYLHRLTAR